MSNMSQRTKIILNALFLAVLWMLAKRFGGGLITRFPALAYDKTTFVHRQALAACIPWVVFSIYWEIAARNATAAKKSESKTSRGLHILLANLALALEIAPIHGLGRFVATSLPISVVGFTVETLGLCMTIWARRHLGGNWSGEISIKVEHQLIRSGPYKRLRHPIYTGLLAMYIGTAIVTGTWLAIAGLAVALFAYWRKISLEETNLHGAFGAEYDSYRRQTWAVVPGIF
jgi:protein-S-isoprenylcysteine O-methyltransferase Ste14